MEQGTATGFKLILPPDGKQTRIHFSPERSSGKNSSDWWHSIYSLFRRDTGVPGPRLEFFSQQLEKEGYSEKSRKAYLFMVRRFFDHYDTLDPRHITMGEIEDYNFDFFVSGRYSRSYQLQFINAIKLYYQLTEGIDLHLKQLRKTGVPRKSV
jgi:hypothetical protein